MNTISADYALLLRQTHAEDPNWGTSARRHVAAVAILAEPGSEVLDYGCGKGVLVEALAELGVKARGYDPGMPGPVSERPRPASLIACIDVLEHIEPDRLDAVLDDIRALAPVAYLVVALLPARKVLPDGRNAHLLVRPADWWLQRLQQTYARVITWSIDKRWLVVVVHRDPLPEAQA